MAMGFRMKRALLQSLLCSAIGLLHIGAEAQTTSEATPSPADTPSPATPSPQATPFPSSTPVPTIAPTPAPESSSSSSETSRGTILAWALFTMAFCVALLILLYNREESKRRRIHPGDSLRQNLTGSDSLQPPYGQDPTLPGHDERDPTMSSF